MILSKSNTRNKSFNVKRIKKEKANHTVREITHGLLQPQGNYPHVCQFKFNIKPKIKVTRASNKLSIYLQIKIREKVPSSLEVQYLSFLCSRHSKSTVENLKELPPFNNHKFFFGVTGDSAFSLN